MNTEKFVSTTILAKDTEVGKVYVTGGGTLIHREKLCVWGFERVKVKKKTEKRVIVQTPWKTECELPLNEELYTTLETQIKEPHPIYAKTQRSSMKKLTFQEAIDEGHEKMSDSKRTGQVVKEKKATKQLTEMEQKIISLLSVEGGSTIVNVGNTLGIKAQIVRNRLKKICDRGYKLVKVDGYVYTLEKVD